MNYNSIFSLIIALVFGYILIQTLLYLLFPVQVPILRVDLPKQPDEYPAWSYYHRYRTWPFGGFGRNDPLPPSSPYVPGVGRVYKV